MTASSGVLREAYSCVEPSTGGPITEGLIREIHRRLVVDVRGGAAHPGDYRHVQNYVANSRTREIIYTPPPPLDVAPLMAELVAWLNAPTEIHPVLASGIAQFQLVHIHPFVDAPRDCSPRCVSTVGVTTSSVCFRSVNTTTATGRAFMPLFKVFASRGWI